jgi:hypothetical protein
MLGTHAKWVPTISKIIIIAFQNIKPHEYFLGEDPIQLVIDCGWMYLRTIHYYEIAFFLLGTIPLWKLIPWRIVASISTPNH